MFVLMLMGFFFLLSTAENCWLSQFSSLMQRMAGSVAASPALPKDGRLKMPGMLCTSS